jgi:hypothetical protein
MMHSFRALSYTIFKKMRIKIRQARGPFFSLAGTLGADARAEKKGPKEDHMCNLSLSSLLSHHTKLCGLASIITPSEKVLMLVYFSKVYFIKVDQKLFQFW